MPYTDEEINQLIAIVESQQTQIEQLSRRLSDLEEKQPAKLINGTLPCLDAISRIECQIFHSPDLTPAQRKTKTEWSLRLTTYVKGRRATPDRNVRLYAGDRFYRQVMELNPLPESAATIATNCRERSGVLLGMLQAQTDGGGSPYVPDQICLLIEHETDSPYVRLHIGADVVEFGSFAPGKGTKAGHAKWYADWHR